MQQLRHHSSTPALQLPALAQLANAASLTPARYVRASTRRKGHEGGRIGIDRTPCVSERGVAWLSRATFAEGAMRNLNLCNPYRDPPTSLEETVLTIFTLRRPVDGHTMTNFATTTSLPASSSSNVPVSRKLLPRDAHRHYRRIDSR